ncbi:Mu-like prophage major head subunit gpT [Gemmobacter aquatilis]|uniref:Mu-like prophage major head subunit gpT n=1 Tax=Gemmobacter aquatilis TaxID=933059 RepID=A0A1H8HPE1_9RHOB|nr:Mu-like prophage major head subunit gpT family protein [Gemmobacter aquatilis]SEN58122.1 Mu-like prophage major head subunit gpT [Gemmobacter aquatilis]
MPFDFETRAALIDTLRSACNLPDTWGDDLAEEAVTEEQVREAAREAMLTRQAPQIRIRRDHTDPAQIQTRAADALAFRMAGGDLPEASREFVNMSMRDLAADCLTRSGVSVRGMSADEVFSRAHGTSDFPLLVSNAMGKVAAQAYQAAESPLKALARQRTLPNFKESTSIRLGEMGRLQEMTEHGEFKHTSRAEAGESMALKTFGRAINVSRKLLIDDDLGLLGDMTAAMGQAAAQTEAEEMVALLSGNSVLSDGNPVFHASRGNLATGAPSELDEGALSAARQHMRTVKGLDGKTIIDAKPKFLIVGPELETRAEKLLASIYATTTDDVAAFAGKLSHVVEPRLAGPVWYLLADPARVASLQYGYLSAAQGVQIQRQEAWDTLGLKYRAWLDFGCGWLDWRGAYRAAGA